MDVQNLHILAGSWQFDSLRSDRTPSHTPTGFRWGG
jgi:hypothetical protein